MGDSNKNNRQDFMEIITNETRPKAKCGVTALIKELLDKAGIDDSKTSKFEIPTKLKEFYSVNTGRKLEVELQNIHLGEVETETLDFLRSNGLVLTTEPHKVWSDLNIIKNVEYELTENSINQLMNLSDSWDIEYVQISRGTIIIKFV